MELGGSRRRAVCTECDGRSRGRAAGEKPAREDGDKRKEEWNKLSPEQREAKRAELRTRLEKRIFELRTKQTNNLITPQELRDLLRSEQVLKRFETNAVPAAPKPTN